MGVKLKKLIESTFIPLTEIKGCKVAVDGMNMLFQILYNPYQMAQKLPDIFYMDSTRRVITHLYGWLQKVNQFYKANVFPVIVFDGKPDPYKRLTTKDYARDYLAVKKKYERAINDGDYLSAKKFALSKSFMFINCIHESKQILESCGVPVIMAPSEAEAQCVSLQKEGLVDYVVSNDFDVMMYGSPKIIRKITFQSRKKVKGKWISYKPNIEVIKTFENLDRLGISLNQLIDLSILVGNDYYPGVKKIGPMKALQSIKYFKNLERIMKKHPHLFGNISLQKIQRIREMFQSPEVIKKPKIKQHPLNLNGLRRLLLSNHKLNSERVERRLKGLERRYKIMAKNWDFEMEKLVYERDNKTNKFLQRQLDRAKKKVPDSFVPKLEFTSAVNYKKAKSKSKSRRKSRTQQKIYHKKLILKTKKPRN
jgi:flap endonuclease-1